MILNYIWIAFFVIGFFVALLRVAGYLLHDQYGWFASIGFDSADREVFTALVDSTYEMAKSSVTIAIVLIGVMALWLGVMKVGERGGAINALVRLFSPLFSRLFPTIPKNHPAIGSMMMNFCANMLGLDNAATPFGLKAMKDLQEINPKKDTASDAMILFLVLNTSGLTLIPVSIMAMRFANGAANPSDIFIPLLLATFCSTLAGLLAVSVAQRINLFNKVVLLYLGSMVAVVGGGLYWLTRLPANHIEIVTRFAGNFILVSLIISFIAMAVRKRVNVYETFVEGAKEGFQVAVSIIPYLVAMLVAIGVFRASGAMDMLLAIIKEGVALTGLHTGFTDALPVALMKPLSGSGARGLMVETMQTYGADSFVGRLASIFQGSTETIFYTLAVYYGSINISKTRYTVGCGLIADLAGIVAAIFIAYLFF